MFLKGLYQIVGMAFTAVFIPEVVDDEAKKTWVPFVVLASESCGGFIVTGFVEAYMEKIIFLFSRLWQAITPSENF